MEEMERSFLRIIFESIFIIFYNGRYKILDATFQV